MDLPGLEEAREFGYSLSYHGGDRQSASYMKDGRILTIWHKGSRLEARLEFVWKLLVVRTPNFTFPSKNWEVFESQITVAKDRLREEG